MDKSPNNIFKYNFMDVILSNPPFLKLSIWTLNLAERQCMSRRQADNYLREMEAGVLSL